MRPILALAALVLFGSTAAAQHQHGKPGSTPEAFTATPAFAPDGTLWVVRPRPTASSCGARPTSARRSPRRSR